MALKNLFDMVKADRYTQDGREALIKAQEAETEDATRRTYQIGEISQATGLQKTANGWVKPKSGKQPGAKKPAEKHPPKVMPEGMSPADFMKAWEDDAKKNGFKKGQGNEWREHLRNEEKKPAAENNLPDIPDFKGMESGDYDNKLRAEGWTTGGWEGNGTHASAIFKKGDRTIRVNEGQPGKITSVQEISKPSESKPAAEKSEGNKSAEWETKGKYQVKKFEDEKTLNNFLKENGFVEEGDETTSFSGKGAIHETVYKKGNETLVKLTGPGINKPTIRKKSKPAAGSQPAIGNNLKWNEMPNGRVWSSKTPGGKPLTVTWNREKNGDVWYGRSDSDIKYKSKEEAMNAPVAKEKKRLTWSPNASVSEKFNDIIKLGAKSEDRTKRPGGYIGPKAQENYIRKALSKRLGATEESIDDLLEGMDATTRKNAFNGFMENYSEDAAPRVLTGDCRIRIRKEKPALTGDTKIRVRK